MKRFERLDVEKSTAMPRPPGRCGSCGKRLAPGTECRIFSGHHARCIERAVARAREAG